MKNNIKKNRLDNKLKKEKHKRTIEEVKKIVKYTYTCEVILFREISKKDFEKAKEQKSQMKSQIINYKGRLYSQLAPLVVTVYDLIL